MKNLWIALLMIFGASTVFAQTFTFGPKIGYNKTSIGINEDFTVEGNTYTIKDIDKNAPFTYGAFARLKVGGLYLQPEMTFNKEVTYLNIQGANFDETHKMTLKKWDFPLLVGTKIFFLRVNGGPVVSMLRSAALDGSSDLFTSLEPQYEETEIGYQLGAGIDLGRLTLDVRYEGSASELGLEMAAAGNDYTLSHNRSGIQASLGWKLIKKSKKR